MPASKTWNSVHLWGFLEQIKKLFTALERRIDLIGVFLTSLVFVLVIPALPIILEYFKNKGHILKSDIYIVSIILASSFGISAEKSYSRVIYIGLILTSFVEFYVTPSGITAPRIEWHDFWAFIGICLLQMSERFWWHVVDEKPFPDK